MSGIRTAATLSADACILLPQFTAQNCLAADLTWPDSASHCVGSLASSRFYACMELQVQVITGNSCRREAACVEQGRVHGFYNNLFRLPTDAHVPCLAATNVIRSSGNMLCRYAQALAVHFPLVCMSMQRPRETPKVEKGCGNSTDVWKHWRAFVPVVIS